MHVIDRKNYVSDEEFKQALIQMYNDDANEYIRQSKLEPNDEFAFNQKTLYPIIHEVLEAASSFPSGFDYMSQDLETARMIHRDKVTHVYDIGSRFEGFITHCLSMDIKVTMLDIRPLPFSYEGFDFIQADAIQGLPELEDNSINAISSLHAFEHFGLGRFGDPVDYNGWKKAINGVKKKLCVGGKFYLGVPLSKQNELWFNAHRYFNPLTVFNAATPDLQLESFSATHGHNMTFKKYLSNVDQSQIPQLLQEITEKYIERDNVGLFVFKKTHLL